MAKLTPHFESLFELLGEGLLASYLLGLSHLTAGRMPALPPSIAFADPVAVAASFNVPPKQAVDYFKGKRTVRKREFDKLTREAKQGAFTVGGVYEDDVLAGFKSELKAALEEGTAQTATVKKFRDILAGAGHKQLGEFHLETVFRTNMQTAYGAGRRRALEQVAEDLPIWEYHAVMDDRTRPTHAALNGIMLPATHEFWSTHFAPWDFNCRCSVTASTEIPSHYNPRNPSGEAELSYDSSGMPAKAEYGTTLYDLQAGKFSGVPKGATLKSAIDAGVTRAKQSRQNRQD